MNREKQAVNTSACSLRRRPLTRRDQSPRYPKSICSSPPGGPSSTGVVTFLAARPRTARRRTGAASAPPPPPLPRQQDPDLDHRHLSLHPRGDLLAAGLQLRPPLAVPVWPCRPDHRHNLPEQLIGQLPLPAPRDKPAATAASTYRLLVLRSTPACAATARSLFPASQARSTSRISITEPPGTPSRRPPVARLEDQTGMKPDKRRAAPLVQLLATGWSHAHGGKHLNLVP